MSPSKLQLKIIGNDIFELCDVDHKKLPCKADHNQLLPSIPESSLLEVGANQSVKIIPGGVSGGITVIIYCNISESSMKSLAVHRDSHKIFLVDINTGDKHQQWDLLHSSHISIIKGKEHIKFVLVNRATGLTLWRSRGKEDQHYTLSLMKFDGRYEDESALWKEGRFAKHGLRRIYAVDNESTSMSMMPTTCCSRKTKNVF